MKRWTYFSPISTCHEERRAGSAEMVEIRDDRTTLTLSRLLAETTSAVWEGGREGGEGGERGHPELGGTGMDCGSIRQQAPSGHVEDRETRHFIRRLPISPTPSKISHS